MTPAQLWLEEAGNMLTRARILHQRPIFFRAGEDVLSSFGVTEGVKYSTLAELPVFPMAAQGLALTTSEKVLTEPFEHA
jgi:hypothetical protein